MHRSTALVSSAVLVTGLVATRLLACGGDSGSTPTTDPQNDTDAATRDADTRADSSVAPPAEDGATPADDASVPGDACAVSTTSGAGSNDAGYGCGDAGVTGFCDNGVRQEPTTCDPLVDAVLSRTPLACASKASTHAYNMDSAGDDPDTLAQRVADMCTLKGAIYWVADMDIDCDGRKTDVCPGTGADMDPSWQGDTSVHTNGNQPLASSLDQYVVIPKDNWKGVTPGAVVAVLYGTKLTYAVFGDTGPDKIIGEGSVALAKALGIPQSPANGGVLGNTVTYIAFTGADAVPSDIEDRAAIETLGATLMQKFLADNSP